ncbi:MAG TPA: CapA family protein [Dehalococcoidia bacterium]|nr:CapA family protein [Dehalococcoidia bacterium]
MVYSGSMRLRSLLAMLLSASVGFAACRNGYEREASPPEAAVQQTTQLLAPSPIPPDTPTGAFIEPSGTPRLTLADIFPPRDLSALPLDPTRLRTLIATGDVIPARYTDVVMRSRGDDFLYPVAAIKEATADADLTVINLEAPLIDGCPYHASGFVFCGRPGFIAALQAAGVDVVTLENNHVRNYGPKGLAETTTHLERAGIAWANRHTPAVLDVRGLTFGFLAFNAVGERIDREGMTEQIVGLRSQVDILVVAFHWGAEYTALPMQAVLAADDPVELGHRAVDAGADLIIGNHPHWVQGLELYAQKLITYAHGNFIFDQMWSYETRVSVIGRYTFYDNILVGVTFMPTLIMNYAQPVLLEGSGAQGVLERMKEASEQLAERIAAAP